MKSKFRKTDIQARIDDKLDEIKKWREWKISSLIDAHLKIENSRWYRTTFKIFPMLTMEDAETELRSDRDECIKYSSIESIKKERYIPLESRLNIMKKFLGECDDIMLDLSLDDFKCLIEPLDWNEVPKFSKLVGQWF